jgi:hypothetical protein
MGSLVVALVLAVAAFFESLALVLANDGLGGLDFEATTPPRGVVEIVPMPLPRGPP